MGLFELFDGIGVNLVILECMTGLDKIQFLKSATEAHSNQVILKWILDVKQINNEIQKCNDLADYYSIDDYEGVRYFRLGEIHINVVRNFLDLTDLEKERKIKVCNEWNNEKETYPFGNPQRSSRHHRHRWVYDYSYKTLKRYILPDGRQTG
jgi:hypothetical protein